MQNFKYVTLRRDLGIFQYFHFFPRMHVCCISPDKHNTGSALKKTHFKEYNVELNSRKVEYYAAP